jgi:RNA polymerase sigma-70 factor (ECF subfamily)
MVFTYCLRRLNDRDAASDCVQEVFVSAWRSRARFDPSAGTLPGWLMGITKFRVVDAFRSSERVPAPVADLPDTETSAAVADHVDQLADRMLVSRAVATLPERARSVVELAFWSDMSQSEIATQLGLPLGTVKSDMRRGLARMREHLDTESTRGGENGG